MAGASVGARNPARGDVVTGRWPDEWSDEQTAKLLELWPDPANTLDVIATATGKTRGAVGGKRRRLKLPTRPSPIGVIGDYNPNSRRARRKAAAEKELSASVTLPPLASEKRSAPPPRRTASNPPPQQAPRTAVEPVQLPSRWPHCQWILGDTKPHRFCQSPCAGTRPYCCEHARRAITGVTRTT